MPTVHVHSTLRLCLGVERLDVPAETCRPLKAILDALPGMVSEIGREAACNMTGSCWLILLNGRNVRLLEGQDTLVSPDARIDILPPACGG